MPWSVFYGRNRHGFSRVDALFCGLIFLCLMILIVPTLQRWRLQKRSLEVVTVSQAIFDAQMVYFNTPRETSSNEQARKNQQLRGRNAFSSAQNDPRMFLSLPPTPETIQDHAQQAAFSERPWSELDLKVNSSVHYQYQVTTNGLTGTEAMFEIIAFGNRDGDEVLSQWRLRGVLNPNGKPMGREMLYRLDPFE